MAGSIRAKGRGRWEVRVSVGKGADGRYRYLSRTVTGTKREAEREAARLLVEHEQRTNHERPATKVPEPTVATAGVTLADYLRTRFLPWKCDLISPTTAERYRSTTDLYVIPTLGNRDLASIDVADLDDLYRHLSKRKGMSGAAVENVHLFLSVALRQAVRWRLIPYSPVPDATKPKRRRREITPPTTDQLSVLLAHADEEVKLVILLAAVTGCRRGELVALEWSDVDWTNGVLSVSKNVVTAPGGTTVKRPKNNKTRLVPLDAEMLAMLDQHRGGATDGPILVNHRHPNSITHAWARVRKAAGLPNVRFHDLRHFTATQLLAAGVDYVTVSQRLGHSSPVVTLSIYAHPVTEAQRQAANVIGGLVLGA